MNYLTVGFSRLTVGFGDLTVKSIVNRTLKKCFFSVYLNAFRRQVCAGKILCIYSTSLTKDLGFLNDFKFIIDQNRITPCQMNIILCDNTNPFTHMILLHHQIVLKGKSFCFQVIFYHNERNFSIFNRKNNFSKVI